MRSHHPIHTQAEAVVSQLSQEYCPPEVIIGAMAIRRAGMKAGEMFADQFKGATAAGSASADEEVTVSSSYPTVEDTISEAIAWFKSNGKIGDPKLSLTTELSVALYWMNIATDVDLDEGRGDGSGVTRCIACRRVLPGSIR